MTCRSLPFISKGHAGDHFEPSVKPSEEPSDETIRRAFAKGSRTNAKAPHDARLLQTKEQVLATRKASAAANERTVEFKT